ncbi:MAG: cell division protein ZapE [Lysobacteraceae bacterium]|nr:MAG: cell division protein ZapE [Xanthomonadaceae bacterium]
MPDPVTTPSARYAQGAARGEWKDDPAQHAALRELDRIHTALLATTRRSAGLFASLFGSPRTPAPNGLYLWGGVGRGKTFLVDLFYDGLPFVPSPDDDDTPKTGAIDRAADTKRRIHFHRFMREVHERLRAHSGERDPLASIAREWGARLRVLVLDEFFVSDIGDAMLLGRLLERLFAEGVVLVTSSNAAPPDLYKDGLQRARFLPAIALLERHCHVLLLDSPTDYRLRALVRSPVYRTPLDDDSEAWLQGRWRELTHGCPQRIGPLRIEDRDIAVRGLAEGFVWFDFSAICEGPRGSADYIEIATEFHTVLIGGVPLFDAWRDDAARRFVTLIDEIYDRHVNLVCTADAAPAALYRGDRLIAAFERTASRLIEMQSTTYLALEHRG